MPISITDLQDDRKTVTLEFGADSLTVTYKPNQLTPARELAMIRQARSEASETSDFEELERAEYNIRRQLATFADLVEAWDFMGPLAKGKDDERLDLPRGETDRDELAAYAQTMGGTLVVGPGEVVPIKPEYLRLIGSNFLMRVVALINEDMRPDPKQRRR